MNIYDINIFGKQSKKSEVLIISKYLDFDRDKNNFYNNIYLDDYKIVVKMPLTKKDRDPVVDVRIEKFDLARYTYLVSYE